MATDFTNKYMQVFQNYNEFGEHSADYVRGEDHIAFLIEENEVIYWLYLEQVWRPLNVRTTTTGELEDGRTKVAVRLEYVEGGQKYTSVPNIPDPERITSMSHFLEDYPDIEEVNVSGTVNLTNLSYAFAGSKIKDFSMLDTSNVTNIVGIFNDINDENLDLNIKLDISKVSNNTQDGITANSINFININKDNYVLNDIGFQNCNINILNLDDFSFNITIYGNDIIIINTINSNKKVNFMIDPHVSNSKNEIHNITCDTFEFGVTSVKANNELVVNCNTAEIDTYGQSHFTTLSKTILETVNDLTFRISNSGIINFNFGSGIKYPSNTIPKLTRFDGTNIANAIGDFWFTTPIVDDNFYADKQYPVSIFQYKATFEEIADINISNNVDTNLIYANFYPMNFDTSNLNLEIHNIIQLTQDQNNRHYKTFIVDNSDFDLNEETAPEIYGDFRITIDNGYISGKYNVTSSVLRYNSFYKNIIFYTTNLSINYKNFDDIINNNVKFDRDYVNCSVAATADIPKFTYIDLYNYILNPTNELKSTLSHSSQNVYTNYIRVTYHENVKVNLNIRGSKICLLNYYDYLIRSTSDNPIKLGNASQYAYVSLQMGENYVNLDEEYETIEEVYIECDDTVFIEDILYRYNYRYYYQFINLYGTINVAIPEGINQSYNTNSLTKHIDINKSKLFSSSSHYDYGSIIMFEKCDNETNTNLIKKLIDNTSSDTKTIYMHRSQANIIGEENIAAAVAKNYEFAIIEN